MSKKIDYSKRLKPIYIESIEANHIYISDCAEKIGKKIEYKIGNSWFEFKDIKTRKAVLTDSLFLRYMASSITRNSGDTCKDFIVVKFNYNAEYRVDNIEEKVNKHDLRVMFYKNGVTYTFEKKKIRKVKLLTEDRSIIRCLCVLPEKLKMANVYLSGTACIIRQ